MAPVKTILHKGNFGIVLNTQSSLQDAGPFSLSGHLILNRLSLDDDGNICLTAPVGLQGVFDDVHSLKIELDGLVTEILLWLTRNIEPRRPRLSVISNDKRENGLVGW